MSADILDALLIASIVLGILLAFISAAAAGRTAADLERLAVRGISGTPRIQAWVNLRVHLSRVLLGAVFVVIHVMLLAGATESWRLWANRTLWLGLLATFLVVSIRDWMAEREQVERGLREVMAERDVLDLLAAEARARRATDAAAQRGQPEQQGEAP